jgi:Iap family predicted aminopeptidase
LDKRIIAEVYTSSEPMKNLEILCDIYGSRFPGTREDREAVEWMMGRLKEYGLEGVHAESFKFPGWIRGPAKLKVTHPIEREIECISLPLGVAGEVEGRLIYLGDGPLEVYEKKRDEIEGNIVMVTSKNPLGMRRYLHRTEKYMRSILAGARGWIFMNHYPAYGPPTGSISPVIPAVGVSYEEGCFLTRLLKREGEVRVRIETTDRNREMETYNVIADIPGREMDEEYLIAGCHYDGHDIAQGALDPASGAVTAMEMARVLSLIGDRLRRRIRIVLFGAEELGLFGSYYYVDKHGGELSSLRFMLNLDTAGREGKRGIFLHGHPELEPFLERASREMGVELPYIQRVTPYSDHWPFFLKGVPCGSGGDPEAIRTGRGYGHTRYDTADKVRLRDLREAASTYARLMLRMADVDDWPGRRLSWEEVEAFVKEQGYDQTIALVERVKEYVKGWRDPHPDTRAWLEREAPYRAFF